MSSGNVVSSGIGQAPTRQSVIYAGLPLDVPSTSINKVCASGMKALMMASMSISAGYRHTMIAGEYSPPFRHLLCLSYYYYYYYYDGGGGDGGEYTNLYLSASCCFLFIYSSLSIFFSLPSLSHYTVILIGGMESMSNIPYYLPGARTGYRLGNNSVVDGLVHDGLWDIYNNQHMGNCGEICAGKVHASASMSLCCLCITPY